MFKTSFLCFYFLLVLSVPALGEARPKWEVGAALGGQHLRDYRGSKESQVQAYPIPFFVYRGDFLKIDRNGVRGELLSNKRVQFNLSGEAALNGSSEDNRLREGMPELESAFELGPSLNVDLSNNDFKSGWQLRLPVRAVVTVGESGVHYQGVTFNPRLTYTKPNIFHDWRWRFNVGGLYGSNRYHAYYYSVTPEFATALRTEYEARGGFSGHYFKTSLSRRKAEYWYGVSLRYDNLSDAAFEDSPLVETEHYFSVSFIVAWLGWSAG